MHPSIEKLLAVQRVDNEIRLLRRAVESRPQELEDDRKRVERARAALASLEAEVKKLRLDADRKELEVKQKDAEIAKLKGALNTAKTNQEYAVLKEQIQRATEERSALEEAVLEDLERIDQLEAKRAGLEEELRESEAQLARREAEVKETVAGLEERIRVLEEERKGLVVGIDPEHLSLYERILAHHGDFAISAVRDSICQGCFMTVTTQNVNLLMLGREIVQCRHCSRLLYLE